MAIIGIGGGGKNIVSYYLQKFPEQKNDVFIINSEEEPYERFHINNTVFIPRDWEEKANKEFMEIIKGVILPEGESTDCYIVVAGLGAETGSRLAPIILNILKEHGLNAGLLATTPFYFEGPERRRRTRDVIEWIKNKDYPAIVFPNDWLLKNLGRFRTMDEVFAEGHKIICRVIEDLINNSISWDSPLDEIREYAEWGWPKSYMDQLKEMKEE